MKQSFQVETCLFLRSCLKHEWPSHRTISFTSTFAEFSNKTNHEEDILTFLLSSKIKDSARNYLKLRKHLFHNLRSEFVSMIHIPDLWHSHASSLNLGFESSNTQVTHPCVLILCWICFVMLSWYVRWSEALNNCYMQRHVFKNFYLITHCCKFNSIKT